MTDELTILRSLENEARERYGNVRFEETPRLCGCASDVFFAKLRNGFATYKHGFLIRVVSDRVVIVPGGLLRGLLHPGELVFELADPTSIEKIFALFEDCGSDSVPTS